MQCVTVMSRYSLTKSNETKDSGSIHLELDRKMHCASQIMISYPADILSKPTYEATRHEPKAPGPVLDPSALMSKLLLAPLQCLLEKFKCVT